MMKEIQFGKIRWINVEQVDTVTLNSLREQFHFHHLDLEDIQTESETPKMDIYKNYLFLILQFPMWDASRQTIYPFEIDFFVGENFVVTIQHTKSKEMKSLFYRCLKNKSMKKEWMGKNSGYLLYKILESLYYHSQPILNNLGRRISHTEQEIFADEPDTPVIRSLGIYRRNVLSFRRIIDPERYLIESLSNLRKPFLGDDTSLYFDNIHDFLNKLWVIIDTYKDTIQGLHVTVESLINQRTNKVISVLTVISVSLLPLTLLSGIYGMNIPLPFEGNPFLIWGMFLTLTTFIIGLILFFKRKRLL